MKSDPTPATLMINAKLKETYGTHMDLSLAERLQLAIKFAAVGNDAQWVDTRFVAQTEYHLRRADPKYGRMVKLGSTMITNNNTGKVVWIKPNQMTPVPGGVSVSFGAASTTTWGLPKGADLTQTTDYIHHLFREVMKHACRYSGPNGMRLIHHEAECGPQCKARRDRALGMLVTPSKQILCPKCYIESPEGAEECDSCGNIFTTRDNALDTDGQI